MYDLSVSYVDAHMINNSGGACPEKDQVALLQIAPRYSCSGILLILGAPLEVYPFDTEDKFGEGGAIQKCRRKIGAVLVFGYTDEIIGVVDNTVGNV
jgi:hypothetical protein